MTQKLAQEEANFESEITCKLKDQEFLQLVNNRDKFFENIYQSSFKPTCFADQVSLPQVYEDILFGLINGYKSTLQAFSKFYKRKIQVCDFELLKKEKLIKELTAKIDHINNRDKVFKEQLKKFEENFEKFDKIIHVFEQDYTILKSQRDDSIKEYLSNIALKLKIIKNEMNVTFDDYKFANPEKLTD